MVIAGLVATTGVAGQVRDKLAIKLPGLFNRPAAGRKNTCICISIFGEKLILDYLIKGLGEKFRLAFFVLVEVGREGWSEGMG